MRNGLLDELNLLVHPIVVGSGRRLFDEDRPPARLELLSAETFGSGVQSLRYHPLPGEAEEGVLFGG
jgi:dihydrofolate reductase